MLAGLGVAISAAGKSIGTHGREGGAQDVVAYQEQQKQEARAQQDQAMKMQEFAIRNKAMVAKTQQDVAVYNHMVSQWPAEDRQRQIALKDATVNSFMKTSSDAASMGYDTTDPAQKAEFEKRAGIGDAAQQPGAISVSLPGGSDSAASVSTIRQAIPAGKTSADYQVFPSHVDSSDHSAGGSAVLVPTDSPFLSMPATPRQVTNTQAETEAMLSQANAAGLSDNPIYKGIEARYNQLKDNLKDGGKPTANQLYTLHMSTAGPLSTLITGQQKADKIAKEKNESDPLYKLENDPSQMEGEKSSDAIALLQNKIGAEKDPKQLVREVRLMGQANNAHAAWLADTQSKENASQAAKQGDPMNAGKMLASGELTLTDLKARGTTPKFIVDSVNAAKTFDPKYNASDEVVGEKALSNVTNQTFYGSAGSLLHQGGLLDQLATQGAALKASPFPRINTWDNFVKHETGSPAQAAFKQTLIGVADDYGKVLGGGQATDAALNRLVDSFTAAQNDSQRAASIQAARDALQSQVRSRVGQNRYIAQRLDFDYGQAGGAAKQSGAAGGFFGQFGGVKH
jgi:hypothetical protein